jgi:hypothetical protein
MPASRQSKELARIRIMDSLSGFYDCSHRYEYTKSYKESSNVTKNEEPIFNSAVILMSIKTGKSSGMISEWWHDQYMDAANAISRLSKEY